MDYTQKELNEGTIGRFVDDAPKDSPISTALNKQKNMLDELTDCVSLLNLRLIPVTGGVELRKSDEDEKASGSRTELESRILHNTDIVLTMTGKVRAMIDGLDI